jgi:hypothetical protein
MKRAAFVLPLLLVFGISSAVAEAGGQKTKPVKNQKLSSYAKNRPRGAKGKFSKLPAGDLLIRGALKGNGRANPSSTGTTTADIDLVPASRAKGGSLVVKMPEMYVGSSSNQARKTPRQLIARDIHGKEVAINGTLEIVGGRNGFSKATFTGTIPAGARLSQRGVEQALKSLQVHQTGLRWKPFDGGE